MNITRVLHLFITILIIQYHVNVIFCAEINRPHSKDLVVLADILTFAFAILIVVEKPGKVMCYNKVL